MGPITILGIVLGVLGAPTSAGRAWHLATDDTRVTIEVIEDRPVITSLTSARSDHDWADRAGLSVPLLATVRMPNGRAPVAWRFEDAHEDSARGTLTLEFAVSEPSLRLRSIWQASPGAGPVRHRLEFDNRSSERVTIGSQVSLALHGLDPGAPAEVVWIRRGGSNASTEGGTFTQPVAAGLDLSLKSDCSDGKSPVPWLAVQVGEERGLYVGWEFSGLGRIAARSDGDGGRLAVDIGCEPDFETDVAPNETLGIPPAFVGCYEGDLDDGSYRLHRFILEKLRPPMPEDYPDPTLAYNLYLDAGGNHATEADVLRSAQFCHDLGFETFVPDAMWFPETGDWRWDPARFPRGIAPIEDYVHHHDMRMALWCAWTNGGVSSDAGALSVRGPLARPDWFSTDYAPSWLPGPFYGALLCLGCPFALDWAERKTQWLVGTYRLDYLKHDISPIVVACNKSTHRHGHEVDASYWAALGYYDVQEKLRRAYPRLVLENCSGGGHIKDFGVIQRTHYTVTTDTLSNLPDRQSLYDSTHAFPPVVLQAYSYDNYYGVPGDEPGPFLWRSAMMGAWQIDPTDTQSWTVPERQSAQRAAEIYKAWIRPILRGVVVRHVLPRPDGAHWDGMFYWNPDLSRGVLFVFRPDSDAPEQTVKLAGLDARSEYWVWSEDRSLPAALFTGAALMHAGLALHLPARYTSDLVYVQQAAAGKPAGLDPPAEFGLKPPRATSDPFAAKAELEWERAANARSYRVVVAEDAGASEPVAETTSTSENAIVADLPPGRKLYWKVEARGWGGTRWSSGGAGELRTPPATELKGVTFASDMSWAKATAGAGNTVHKDTNYYGKPVTIGHERFVKALWTHAFPDSTPADVVYDMSGRHEATFVASVGLDDSAGAGSVQFEVLADDRLVAESPVLRHGVVDVLRADVSGARFVTLRVRNGGDGYECDHAAWGWARFIEASAPDALGAMRR